MAMGRQSSWTGNWREDWKEDLAKTVAWFLIGGLCIAGGCLLLGNGRNFWTALKPGYDVEYLMDNGGAKEGMHVTGQVPYVYDCFANLSDFDGKDISGYYYALPVLDGMLILEVPESRYEVMETLWEETWQHAADGILPASPVPVEGYVEKAKGRLPYLLSEYLQDVLEYSPEEVDAMGEPLMIVYAAEKLQRARIYAPVGMILLTSGILFMILYLFLQKRRLEKEIEK
nr:DUF6709 family protein [uncultured Acetatifactor sp.]